jgi:hypothetical protein
MMLMNMPEGDGAYQRQFWQHFPPPNTFGDSLLSLNFCVFDLHVAALRERPGDPFYSQFTGKRMASDA